MSKGTLTVLQLYPDEMNIYGDYGNILTLSRRIAWHGYTPKIRYHHPGASLAKEIDIVVGGGGQDSGQLQVADDLRRHGEQLRRLCEDGLPMLMVCGLYQLFGHQFVTADNHTLEGIGIFDVETVGATERMTGNIITESELFGTIIGYENHSGATYLRGEQQPFATVKKGAGNNGRDKTEGALTHNAIGTYLHGSLLPNNPDVADHLIEIAAVRRFGDFRPEVIDDHFASLTHQTAWRRKR